MTTLPSWRTFIAVELSKEVKEGLQQIQDELRGQVSPRSIRWVRPDGIHLTLKFLGDTPVDKVEQVKRAVLSAAAEAAAFSITVSGLGCFPNSRQPRVVWVGLQEPTGALAHLRDAVESHVAPLGFPTERRAFQPHLTLGRVQHYASKSELRQIGEAAASPAGVAALYMAVNVVSLIKSDLRPSGAVYTTLCEAQLGGD